MILLFQEGAVPELAAKTSAEKRPSAVDSFLENFSLTQNVRKHQFKDLPIKLHSTSVKARLHPRAVTITILGPALEPAKKAALKKKIIAYIDLTKVSPGVYVRPAKIRLPPGYVLLDAKPEIFVVEVKTDR